MSLLKVEGLAKAFGAIRAVDLRAGQITSVLDNILHQPPPPHLDLQARERRERSAT